MRTFLLLLSTSLVLLWGCQSESPSPIQLTIELQDSTFAPLVLVPASQKVDYRSYMRALDTIELQASGVYTFAWEADSAAFYWVVSDKGTPLNHAFYLQPGDSLVVTLPSESGEAPTYEGAGADFYPFFYAHNQRAWQDSAMRAAYQDRYYLEMDPFVDFMQDRRNQLMEIYEAYQPRAAEQSPLLEYARNYIDYQYASGHYDYLEYHNYYANDTFLYLYPDSSYFAFEETITPPSLATCYVSDFYLPLVKGRLEKLYREEVRGLSDSLQWERAFLGKWEILQQDMEGIDRDYGLMALAQDFTYSMDREDFYPTLDAMEDFITAHPGAPGLNQKFLYQVNKMKALAPGQPAPALTLPDVDGNPVSLDDFRGKVVYLDFWGTWCYPCLQEIPHSLELEEEFGEEEVAFVYVALEYAIKHRSGTVAPICHRRASPGLCAFPGATGISRRAPGRGETV
jgi:thiol-disulfide isomerase/thioredoxin